MGVSEEGGWFAGWCQRYLSRSGAAGRYAKVHPDYWDEVWNVLKRHRMSSDEAEQVMQHLIRHGPFWPDELMSALERAISAVRPTVLVAPPIVCCSGHAQRDWVRSRLVSGLGLDDSLELESRCYAVLMLAAERLVRDSQCHARPVDQYSDESVQAILSEAMDQYMMMQSRGDRHE